MWHYSSIRPCRGERHLWQSLCCTFCDNIRLSRSHRGHFRNVLAFPFLFLKSRIPIQRGSKPASSFLPPALAELRKILKHDTVAPYAIPTCSAFGRLTFLAFDCHHVEVGVNPNLRQHLRNFLRKHIVEKQMIRTMELLVYQSEIALVPRTRPRLRQAVMLITMPIEMSSVHIISPFSFPNGTCKGQRISRTAYLSSDIVPNNKQACSCLPFFPLVART